jgi:hypothetical protein
MGLAGNVARTGDILYINTYKILVGKPEEK